MSSKPVVFVIGGPGSGKGTQCNLMIEKFGFTHLSTGDLLRDEVASGSERGKRINEIMMSGKLVPLDEVLQMLKDAIKKSGDAKGILIDGYPRELEQAIRFENEVCKCSLIIYFDCRDESMLKRLLGRGKSSGRSDDKEDAIKVRLETFHRYTKAILDHYGDSVNLINAERPPNEIFKDVSKLINNL